MPLPFINNSIALARHVWKSGEHHYYVTRTYRISATLGTHDLNLVAAQLANRHAKPIASLMAGSYTQVGTYVHVIRPFSWPGVGFGGYFPDPSPYSSNCLPPQVALLLRLFPTSPLPRKYARVYLPLMPEEANDSEAKVSAAFRTLAQTTLTPLVTAFAFPSPPGQHFVIPVVFHRIGGTTTPVTSLEVSDLWASQGRRSWANTPTPAPFRSLD